MLQKDFAPYEPSLALKELGFDEPCLAFWDAYNGGTHLLFKQRIEYHWLLRLFGKKPEPVLEISNEEIEYLEGDGVILAPTFSQAFRFFREKYGLRNSITDFIDDETGIEWDYEIAIIGTDLDEKGNYKPLVDYSVDDETRKFKTYEEAELGCLLKLIEIVKEKKNG